MSRSIKTVFETVVFSALDSSITVCGKSFKKPTAAQDSQGRNNLQLQSGEVELLEL